LYEHTPKAIPSESLEAGTPQIAFPFSISHTTIVLSSCPPKVVKYFSSQEKAKD